MLPARGEAAVKHMMLRRSYARLLSVLPLLMLAGCWQFSYPCGVACGGCSGRECPPNPPPCTNASWVISCVPSRCALVMEPDGTPPQARMKLGSETTIELHTYELVPNPCLTVVVGPSLIWASSDPSVAAVRGIGAEVATLTALGAGDTQISVEGMQTSGGPFKARLAVCRPGSTPCTPVDLVLRVVP